MSKYRPETPRTQGYQLADLQRQIDELRRSRRYAHWPMSAEGGGLLGGGGGAGELADFVRYVEELDLGYNALGMGIDPDGLVWGVAQVGNPTTLLNDTYFYRENATAHTFELITQMQNEMKDWDPLYGSIGPPGDINQVCFNREGGLFALTRYGDVPNYYDRPWYIQDLGKYDGIQLGESLHETAAEANVYCLGLVIDSKGKEWVHVWDGNFSPEKNQLLNMHDAKYIQIPTRNAWNLFGITGSDWIVLDCLTGMMFIKEPDLIKASVWNLFNFYGGDLSEGRLCYDPNSKTLRLIENPDQLPYWSPGDLNCFTLWEINPNYLPQ